ncbi:putative acetyltransferase [Paenibacillus sp. V4I3]|uniref:GNAT family N-acetyltransferase n=1 Tax=unclassified Paenibacillus TaxID=185978 RepID=UPI0027866761|nr:MULTISPECIES: GNAT family N-acetyltransferase [unclassified Paenibacillus]MDQ0875987.1 putative acetyltransferase [Paenibacillus sp. V4I3]MDQ0887997.1 putative acetyltransferase [Paenibacillus sp. V4I9]
MIVVLEKITDEGLDALKNLFEFAAYDLSELNSSNINEKGSYISILNCRDWYEDPNYDLFFIRVDGELAGFVIIKHLLEEEVYYLNHFFILRKNRRNNIGKQAAIQAFKLYMGKWRVSQFDWNTPAQIFWRKVIKEFTSDQYYEIRRKDNKGPAQEFTYCYSE